GIKLGIERAKADGTVDKSVTYDIDYVLYDKANPSVVSDALKAKIEKANYVVITSETGGRELNGWASIFPRTVTAYTKSMNIPTVAISINQPYDIANYPDAPAIMAAYGAIGMDPTDSLEPENGFGPNIPAAIEVTLGNYKPQGKLPVDIPKVENGAIVPGTIAYPLGFGLSYADETPSYTPPTTKTETRKNSDGSTTKIVTNLKTGAVTETTTWPDGTKIVTTTAKDGTGTSEVTVPKDKDSVTVTIPTAQQPGPGQVAVIVKSDGTREIVKTSVATEGGMRVTLTEGAKLEIIDNSKRFSDVETKDWFDASVQFVASRELFTGTSANTFSPDATTSRAMLMTVLARLDGQDTSRGEFWYSAGMEWAKKTGISDGTNPDHSITREQLALMLYRYAKAEKPTGGLDTYSDAGQVSAWATEAMAWAVEQGIIQGAAGRLNPTDIATRAEVAAMLERFVKR
ncbi:MAG TPA: S-layer homology domain-containing protein, partial [Pseudoflavonifractor sp.]|nr:S-layer homology domain-containing protein [Pseudoflavonifractor sp.]